jgi:hypothetical protein
LHYTEDFGENWHQVEGISGRDIYIIGDPNDADYFFASDGTTVFISDDKGRSFSSVSGAMPRARRIAVIPEEKGAFYVPSMAGLQKISEYGNKVELIPNILFCDAVGVGRGKYDDSPHVIYIWGSLIGNDTRGLFMSEDNGINWVRVNDDLHHFGGPGNGHFVAGDMNVYGRVYMSSVGLGIVYFDKIDKGIEAANE